MRVCDRQDVRAGHSLNFRGSGGVSWAPHPYPSHTEEKGTTGSGEERRGGGGRWEGLRGWEEGAKQKPLAAQCLAGNKALLLLRFSSRVFPPMPHYRGRSSACVLCADCRNNPSLPSLWRRPASLLPLHSVLPRGLARQATRKSQPAAPHVSGSHPAPHRRGISRPTGGAGPRLVPSGVDEPPEGALAVGLLLGTHRHQPR